MWTCPHCSAVVLGEPGASGLYDCKGCGAEIEASAMKPIAPAQPPVAKKNALAVPKPASPVERKLLSRPEELTVTELQGATRLEWTVRGQAADTMVGTAAVLILVFGGYLVANAHGPHAWLVGGLLGASVLGIGLGLWWQSKPKRRAVMLRRDSLEVERWPRVKLDPAKLSQVYVKQVVHTETYRRGRGWDDPSVRTWYTYDLCARLKDGQHVTILENAGYPELALHLEREIEKHYRIADARVAYELPRD